MKTATELFNEYYAKPPVERVNTTLQDYVFNHQQAKIDAVLEYMNNEDPMDIDITHVRELLK